MEGILTRAPGLLLVAAAALVDRSGRVLVQQRRGGVHAGLWEFPGGKLEAGETPAEALARELGEELDILVEPADLTPAAFSCTPLASEGRPRSLLLLLHICRTWHGEPRAVEATALRWATAAELSTLEMPPADIPLIAALAALL